MAATEFLLRDLRGSDGRLLRTYNQGRAHLAAYLEDHAFLLEALLTLYEATFDPYWFAEARATADVILDRFADRERGGFFSTADDHERLIARRKDIDDAPIPSGPPFFRFSDESESRRALLEAGFAAPQFRKIPQTWRLHSPQDLWEFMLGGTVRTGALLRAQAPQALQAIRAEVIAASGKQLPMPAVLASATKGSA